MKETQMLEVVTRNPFSMKDRIKILFGHHVLNKSVIEVQATYVAKARKVEIAHEMKGMQTFLGRPKKQAQVEK